MSKVAMARLQDFFEGFCHGALDARGSSTLVFFFFYRFFYHGIQHKNAKQEIQGGDKRLPLGLCSFALEKPQLENEKEKYVIHMKP